MAHVGELRGQELNKAENLLETREDRASWETREERTSWETQGDQTSWEARGERVESRWEGAYLCCVGRVMTESETSTKASNAEEWVTPPNTLRSPAPHQTH